MPYRSAISGEYVKKSYADKHKNTTVFEKPPKPAKSTKPKK